MSYGTAFYLPDHKAVRIYPGGGGPVRTIPVTPNGTADAEDAWLDQAERILRVSAGLAPTVGQHWQFGWYYPDEVDAGAEAPGPVPGYRIEVELLDPIEAELLDL